MAGLYFWCHDWGVYVEGGVKAFLVASKLVPDSWVFFYFFFCILSVRNPGNFSRECQSCDVASHCSQQSHALECQQHWLPFVFFDEKKNIWKLSSGKWGSCPPEGDEYTSLCCTSTPRTVWITSSSPCDTSQCDPAHRAKARALRLNRDPIHHEQIQHATREERTDVPYVVSWTRAASLILCFSLRPRALRTVVRCPLRAKSELPSLDFSIWLEVQCAVKVCIVLNPSASYSYPLAHSLYSTDYLVWKTRETLRSDREIAKSGLVVRIKNRVCFTIVLY